MSDMTELSGLRIGLVGPLAPPAGGMANQTRQLAELLRADQAVVIVVQTNAPYRPAWVARVPGLRAAFRLLPYLLALWRAAGRVDVFHVMANSGWSWHLFVAPAIWIAWARGVPVVVNYRGGGAEGFLVRSHRAVSWTLKRAARLVVPSGFLQDVFARFGMQAEVVPNIVDLALFRPQEDRPEAHPHLLVARNLEPVYDNATALRAFRLILDSYPDVVLTIAGSGPEESRLHHLAIELGIHDAVLFAGRLDRGAMADLFRQADIMLNPSLADNMPNSVLESMASGVPVVSTDVGGVPYVVQDNVTALLVSPGRPDLMAAAAMRLLGDIALWQRLSSTGLAEARRYTWSQVRPVLAAVYRSVLVDSRKQLV